MLTQRLRDLELQGLVERQGISGRPHSLYGLTARATSLKPVLQASGPVEEVARALSGVDLTPFSIANGSNSRLKRSVRFSEGNFRSTV